MNLKKINDLFSDSRTFIDDQIIKDDNIQFDVFIFDKRFYHFELTDGKTVTHLGKTYYIKNDRVYVDNEELKKGIVIPHKQLRIFTVNLPKKSVLIGKGNTDISIGKNAWIKIEKENESYKVIGYSEKEDLFWNDQRIAKIEKHFRAGDRFVIKDEVIIELRPKQLKITPLNKNLKINIDKLLPTKLITEYPEEYPDFRRSPRLYLKEPKAKIQLDTRESLEKEQKGAVMGMLLPPLGMLGVSGLLALFTGGNPLMILGMGSMSLFTASYSVSSYFTNRKELRRKNKKITDTYDSYLIDKAKLLEENALKQKQVRNYNYPDSDNIVEMINRYDARLYEKLPKNDDFLSVSLGKGIVNSSFDVVHDVKESEHKEEIEKFVEKRLVDAYQTIKGMPVSIEIENEVVGLIGEKQARKEAIEMFLLQIAAFHSYRDVQFIIISNEEEYKNRWEKWRWLEHFKIQELNLRGMVYDAQTRDMILNSFYQLLVKRRQNLKEFNSEKVSFLPHFIVVVEDENLLMGNSINEFLNEDISELGVSVIWSKDTQSMLPETITTLVEYNNRHAGRLITAKNSFEDIEFSPERYPRKYSLEKSLRKLANLNLLKTEKNSIPEKINFLELYKSKTVNDLKILNRWRQADTAKTLAVPLGLRGKNDVVYLNLHERAHGPHGLIAGTTGSGKSELVQTYMLSLAVNFSPEDVGFLPIDFKGGGMANLFKGLPHLLGSITNLDGASAQRALKSIHAELVKRQSLFSRYGVNNINAYTKLYKQGKQSNGKDDRNYPLKPLPHLFLISDEFAELKANEPEFMDELVSTARIGRSLGVHLILATQKPSGVVNDQIWSNSKFKIALKVSEKSDSQEVLHTPDAATIVEPGRAYLQVGNNEIYELFQSAYSGGNYLKNSSDGNKKIDDRIWLINHLGQAELLTQDLSLDEEDSNEDATTELEAVIEEIKQDYQNNKKLFILPDKPWLPELSTVIFPKDIDWKKNWQDDRDLAVSTGKLDIPSKQLQKDFVLDVHKQTPLLVVGSSGQGKSIFIQSLVTQLSKKNNPEDINFYLLDFGGNGLTNLSFFPQVGDIVRLNEKEKLNKALRYLNRILETRKLKLQKARVANLEQYESVTKEKLPEIIIGLDGYDALGDDLDQKDIVDSFLDKIIREGKALGIYVVVTTNRYSSIRSQLMENIKEKIVLYLVDQDGAREVFGRDALIPSPHAGRGQIKLEDEVVSIQISLPGKGEDTLSRNRELQTVGELMEKSWKGNIPAAIPMLPKEISINYFFNVPSVKQAIETGKLPLALSKETTEVINYDYKNTEYFVIMDDTYEQREGIQKVLSEDLKRMSLESTILDIEDDNEMVGFDTTVSSHEVDEYFTWLVGEIKERKQTSSSIREELLIYVPNVEKLNSLILEKDFKFILREAHKVGVYLLFHGNQQNLEKVFGNPLIDILRTNIPAGAVSTKIIEQQFIKAKGTYKEENLSPSELNFFKGRNVTRGQVIL